MMRPPAVRYTTTRDGVQIAYSTCGEGSPLLYLTGWWNNIEKVWDVPTTNAWWSALSARWQLILMDVRGTGLSDRHVEDFGPATMSLDVDAVWTAVGCGPVTLFSMGPVAAGAMAFLLNHPEAVDRLVLWDPRFRSGDTPETRLLGELRAVNPDLWMRTINLWSGWEDQYSREQIGRFYKDNTFFEPGFLEALNGDSYVKSVWAYRERLVEVTLPTLVAGRENALNPWAGVREIGREIPSAKVVKVDGYGHAPQNGDIEPVLALLEEFIPRTSRHESPEGAFQTILFTDLESSTALTQRLGDEAAQEVLRGHNTTVRAALEAHGGREVKHTGDGIMAAFPSAVRAVEAALQVQRDLAGGEVRVRMGLNAGEPIAEENDLFGTAVQLAARICDRAEPGQVLVSRVVADLCAGKKLQFRHHSDATLKGFTEPVALYEVGH
jgi:class 3 adenylate cyclase